MKIVIIDDEQHCRDFLVQQIEKNFPSVCSIHEAESVESGVAAISKAQPDVVFLDIHLRDGSGFDILNQLDSIAFKTIFTTAFDQYAIKAFKYSAVHYLLKPLDPKELAEAYLRISAESFSQENSLTSNLIQTYDQGTFDSISLKTENDFHTILLQDIFYLEADGSYCLFHLRNKKTILVSKPLKEYKELLPETTFVRIHKSYLVNMENVKSYKYSSLEVELAGGESIFVARRNKTSFLELVSHHPHIKVEKKR